MRRPIRSRVCFLAAFLTVTPLSPERHLDLAKNQMVLADKISALRRCLEEFPIDPLARTARDQLVSLLSASNRYEEALREYRRQVEIRKPSGEPDLKLLELLMKTGHYREILHRTAAAPRNGHDFLFDKRLFEFRVQAFLAKGRYREARLALEQWLSMHTPEGLQTSRFEPEVRTLQQLRRYLLALERIQGATGKPLFTASVPDSLKRWSRRKNVPIVFFKLIPADPAGQIAGPEPLESEIDASFRRRVQDMNRGFRHLSGGAFSLSYRGSHTLYVGQSDWDLAETLPNVLASRVYVHTLPPLYRMAGRAFVVLVDYRVQTDGQAAYMGDGLIHVAAGKLRSVTLMHELLHGLGATHQEWSALIGQGYGFDPGDRGLMTFDQGELRDFGLEEKNRVLLDWPRVTAIRLRSDTADLPALPNN